MKYRSSSPIVLTLGLAALLSGCPSTTPTTSTTPAPGATSAVPVEATPAPAATSPASSATASPAVSTSPGLTPGATGSPSASSSGGVPEVPGVKITVHKPGNGEPLAAGKPGRFHYTGWLEGYESAKKFDSSKDRNQPFEVTLGQGMVIPGWDQGLIGMLPGETRRLEIAPDMAYGATGAPPSIPPNSTLFFEVEYLGPVQ